MNPRPIHRPRPRDESVWCLALRGREVPRPTRESRWLPAGWHRADDCQHRAGNGRRATGSPRPSGRPTPKTQTCARTPWTGVLNPQRADRSLPGRGGRGTARSGRRSAACCTPPNGCSCASSAPPGVVGDLRGPQCHRGCLRADTRLGGRRRRRWRSSSAAKSNEALVAGVTHRVGSERRPTRPAAVGCRPRHRHHLIQAPRPGRCGDSTRGSGPEAVVRDAQVPTIETASELWAPMHQAADPGRGRAGLAELPRRCQRLQRRRDAGRRSARRNGARLLAALQHAGVRPCIP